MENRVTDNSKSEDLQGNVVPLWTPRFWNGMTLVDYLRLVCRSWRQVSPSRWHLALITFISALFNSTFAMIQLVLYGHAIQKQPLPDRPVFVIGHFRTGTTMLLEYLSCDPQYCWPTTYQCFAPKHFLVTGTVIPLLMRGLLPAKRPIDNMEAGFDRPQEDEFAMLSLAAPTIYRRIAFPNQPTPFMETLTMEKVHPKVLRRWRRKLVWFYKAISLKRHGRLLIKSPVHTGRIAELLRMFPNAKFVHVVRNPEEIFPSIRNAWRVLDLTQGFEAPDTSSKQVAKFEDFVLETLDEMYRGFAEQSAGLTGDQLCTVKYEDLKRDPVEAIRQIYRQLELGDFETLRHELEQKANSQREYQSNRFEIDDHIRTRVGERWAAYKRRFDYE